VHDSSTHFGRNRPDTDDSELPPATLVELETALRYSLRWAAIPEPTRSALKANVAARRAAQDGAV